MIKSWTAFFCLIYASMGVAEAAKVSPANLPFYENPKAIERVALVTDVVMTTDIIGKDLGVHRFDHTTLVPLIADGVKQKLAIHGFEVVEQHTNSGLFIPPEAKLVYVEKGYKSSGEVVVLPFFDPNPPTWVQSPLQSMMNQLHAPMKNRDGMQRVELPEEIKSLPVDALIVITSRAVNVPTSKSLGLAFLTAGVGMGAASSLGLPFFTYSFPVSGGAATVTIIDTRDGNVLWQDAIRNDARGEVGATSQVRSLLRQLLHRLPYRLGVPQDATEESEEQTDDGSSDEESNSPAPAQSPDVKGGVVSPVAKELSTRPTIVQAKDGWTRRDLRIAFDKREIQKWEFKILWRRIIGDYKQAHKDLKSALKRKDIDRHHHDIEMIKVEWTLAGWR